MIAAALAGVGLAVVLAGCGGGGGATAGTAAKFIPAGAVLYVHGDRSSKAWQKLQPLERTIWPTTNTFGDGGLSGKAHTLLSPLAGQFLDPDFYPDDATLAPSLGGETGYALLNDAGVRFVQYESVSDRAGVARWLVAHGFKAGATVAGFARYQGSQTRFGTQFFAYGQQPAALSDDALLFSDSTADLTLAIESSQGKHSTIADDPAFRTALKRSRGGAAAYAFGRGLGRSLDATFAFIDSGHDDSRLLTQILGSGDVAESVWADGAALHMQMNVAGRTGAFNGGDTFATSAFEDAARTSLAVVQASGLGPIAPIIEQRYGRTLANTTPADEQSLLTGSPLARIGGTTAEAQLHPADAAAAVALLQRAQSSPGFTVAARDGGVQVRRSLDPATYPGGATDSFLAAAHLPGKVALAAFADDRQMGFLRHEFGSGDLVAPSANWLDKLGQIVLWATPHGDDLQVELYAEIR